MGTPCGARTGIARAPHWNLECFSYPTGPVRGLCGTRKGAIRQPYGHVRELTQPELLRSSYESVLEKLVSVPEQLVSVPEQLVSVPEQL